MHGFTHLRPAQLPCLAFAGSCGHRIASIIMTALQEASRDASWPSRGLLLAILSLILAILGLILAMLGLILAGGVTGTGPSV